MSCYIEEEEDDCNKSDGSIIEDCYVRRVFDLYFLINAATSFLFGSSDKTCDCFY